MDIINQSELTLRNAGYETWPWSGGRFPVMCFENLSVVGFLHVFPSAASLVEDWETAQRVTLARFVAALKMSGDKAWNVYSIFLTEQAEISSVKRIEQIEEDFALTRKIARCGVRTPSDLQQALLSLLPIVQQPSLHNTDFAARLRTRLHDVPSSTADAFVGAAKPRDVAEMLKELP